MVARYARSTGLAGLSSSANGVMFGSRLLYGPFLGVIENTLGRLRLDANMRAELPKRDYAWRNKVAVVTGASSGIGYACATRLAASGAQVVLAARSGSRLEALAEECAVLGGRALTIPTDVGDEASCARLVDRAVRALGQIDLLVNNAGIGVGARFDDLTDLDLFRRVVDVNFYGHVYCTYHALPHLKKAQGRILGISGLGGRAAVAFNTSYCASKFGLEGFYDSLRMELRGTGVSVTVVSPYRVATEFHERQMDRRGSPRGAASSSLNTSRGMTARRCAEIALNAARRRRREVLMSPGWLVMCLKLISPALLDHLVVQTFLEPASRRIQAARHVDG